MANLSREERIKLRAQLYAEGVIDLQGFFDLEMDSQEEDELSQKKTFTFPSKNPETDPEDTPETTVPSTDPEAPLVGMVADEDPFYLGDLGEPTDDYKKTFRSVLKDLTKEEFNALSMYEQQRLYDFDPEAVEKILSSKPTVREILSSADKKSFSSKLTVEDFNSMSLNELNDLYREDPDLYNRLSEESLSGR